MKYIIAFIAFIVLVPTLSVVWLVHYSNANEAMGTVLVESNEDVRLYKRWDSNNAEWIYFTNKGNVYSK